MFRYKRAELEVVEIVLARELVRRPFDECEFVDGDANRLEDGKKDEFVVFGAMGNEF